MALSPKTARTLNKKKKENELCSSIDRMFACIRRRKIIAANEKLGFQPRLEVLERVERCC